jgi:hypothetical protein
MENNRPMVDEEKEKKAIAWENKVLSVLMPSVGLIAFILGLVGFILVIQKNTGVAVFLILLAALGLGGVTYGVVDFIKRRNQKRAKKEEQVDK